MLATTLGGLSPSDLAAECARRDEQGRSLLHAAVGDALWEHVAVLGRLADPGMLLRTSARRLTAVGLAITKGQYEHAEQLERIVLERLAVRLELVYAPAPDAAARADEVEREALAVWPQLNFRARPAHAADGSRAGANHAFDLLWVERWAAAWGPSRHSAVLYAHEEGEPLPATRALLRLVRRKVEGEGVLDSVAARGEA